MFILEYFFISVSTSMGTKKGRIYGKGAPFKGVPQTFEGEVAPNCPPGSATDFLSCKEKWTRKDAGNVTKI